MPETSAEGLNRWRALLQICGWLAPQPQALAPAEGEPVWSDIVAVASEHLVTPALSRPLAGILAAPAEAQQYFDIVRGLNAVRNETICEVLEIVLRALNRIDVQPVLLKGAAMLASGLYRDPAERIIGDIDLLIPASRLAAAASALRQNGFAPENTMGEKRWIAPSSHERHLAPLLHADTGAGVELHRELFGKRYQALLPAAEMLAGSVMQQWRGADIRMPAPTHLVMHNIVHDQLHHGAPGARRFHLRSARELVLLASRAQGSLDWRCLEARFLQTGHDRVLREQASICHALLGAELPVAGVDPDKALAELRDTLLKGQVEPNATRRVRVRTLSRNYVNGFLAEPGLALNFLNPAWWPRRVRGWKEFIAGKRP